MANNTYRSLIAWQQGMKLVEAIYKASRRWPASEVYALTSQIRRASVSIVSNIAEGWGRGSPTEFRAFLRTAYGSLMEVETQVEVAYKLEYIAPVVHEHLLAGCSELGKVLNGLMSSVRVPGESPGFPAVDREGEKGGPNAKV